MEWIRSLQNAIDFIEENLLNEITAEDIAAKAYCSSFHFQRVFSLLTGMTVGDYIRNRRLSLAGEELSVSNKKVIDVALKYGYDTPESFAKAFSRFHGITPIMAKKEGCNLKSFNRLIIKIKLEGGSVMDYKIITKPEIKVLAIAKTFNSESSKDEIPKFWATTGKDKNVVDTLCKAGIDNSLVGICEQQKQGSDEFRYLIGAICGDDTKAPSGFEVITIPSYTWAVFKCVGAMPNAIQNLWARIYSEFFPQSEYEQIHDYDVEWYSHGNLQGDDYISEIWLPVKKKQ